MYPPCRVPVNQSAGPPLPRVHPESILTIRHVITLTFCFQKIRNHTQEYFIWQPSKFCHPGLPFSHRLPFHLSGQKYPRSPHLPHSPAQPAQSQFSFFTLALFKGHFSMEQGLSSVRIAPHNTAVGRTFSIAATA